MSTWFSGEQYPHDEQADAARLIAEVAHRGQTDKLGRDYISHPARVADRIRFLAHPVEYCAAWLHDVIEDAGVTVDDLRAVGIAEDVIEVVLLLTRDKDASDPDDYYRRISADDRAFMVKLADIADNLDPERTSSLPRDLRERLATKYRHALDVLGAPDFWLWQGEQFPNTAKAWREFLRGGGGDGYLSSEDIREVEAYRAWCRAQAPLSRQE